MVPDEGPHVGHWLSACGGGHHACPVGWKGWQGRQGRQSGEASQHREGMAVPGPQARYLHAGRRRVCLHACRVIRRLLFAAPRHLSLLLLLVWHGSLVRVSRPRLGSARLGLTTASLRHGRSDSCTAGVNEFCTASACEAVGRRHSFA